MQAKRASAKAVRRGYEWWRDIHKREIQRLEAEGLKTHAEIARHMGLSPNYVRKIRLNLWD